VVCPALLSLFLRGPLQVSKATLLSCHSDGKSTAPSVWEISLFWWRFLCVSSNNTCVHALAVSLADVCGGSLVLGITAEFEEQESVLTSVLLAWEVTL